MRQCKGIRFASLPRGTVFDTTLQAQTHTAALLLSH